MSANESTASISNERHWEASYYRSEFARTKRDLKETLAFDFDGLGPTKAKALPWSPHLFALLQGTRDEASPLRVLAGNESTIIKDIYEMLVETWCEHIVLTPPAHAVGRAVANFAIVDDEDWEFPNHVLHNIYESSRFGAGCHGYYKVLGSKDGDRPEVAFSLVGKVEFPPPMDLNVNMLPFIMGREESLPEGLRPYYRAIIAKCPVKDEEYGKVVYLTVSEGLVEASSTQRRSGLHVEAAAGVGGVCGAFKAGTESNWGGGVSRYLGEPDSFDGGLYMASNTDDTCMLWDAVIAKGQGIVDYHGGGDHLRPFIGKGTKLKANELAWLTDRTPHEALPQTKQGYRQFFRLVTSNISVWFKQHSTPNPKVPVPDHVQIIEDDKFATASDQQTK